MTALDSVLARDEPSLLKQHGLTKGTPVVRLRWYAYGAMRETFYLYDSGAASVKRWLESQGHKVGLAVVPWNGVAPVSLDDGR